MVKKIVFLSSIFLVETVCSTSGAILFQEDFTDDFLAGRNIPDTVVANKSSDFTYINNHDWSSFMGLICMRDRDWADSGGEYGGFQPKNRVVLDICGGYGKYITFRVPSYLATDLRLEFEVLAYGGDGGHLFKYVSADGDHWVQVGDSSDAMGVHSYNLLPNVSGETYFRLQAGTSAGIFEGIHIGNLKVIPEPCSLVLLGLGGLALRYRKL